MSTKQDRHPQDNSRQQDMLEAISQRYELLDKKLGEVESRFAEIEIVGDPNRRRPRQPR